MPQHSIRASTSRLCQVGAAYSRLTTGVNGIISHDNIPFLTAIKHFSWKDVPYGGLGRGD